MVDNPVLRLINGQYAKSCNVIARCHCSAHRGLLSKNLVKSHACLEKRCTFMEKLNPEHWAAMEAAALEKKENRLKRKLAAKENDRREALIRSVLEKSGHVHVTAIHDARHGLLEISYIYDKRVDLTPGIRSLRSALGKAIRLRARATSDDLIELLIRIPRRETRCVTDPRVAPKVGDATRRRLAEIGVFCLEDLFGRSGESLYALDSKQSARPVNRRYLAAYRSACEYANERLE